MFEISDDAKELIRSCLDDAMEGRPELRRGNTRIALRLNIQRGKAYLSLAFPRPADRVMTFMGRPLLIVAPEDYSRLERIKLTVKQGPGGNFLSLEPNVPEQSLNAEYSG